jgi:hypothetical protein
VGFSVGQYTDLRPTLWHLTHRQNLNLIAKERVLKPAALLTSANLDRPRRARSIIPGMPVLRDQKPLCEKCIALQGGLSFADWLREMNRRVFFWPGRPDRPAAGLGAIKLYSNSDILIRLPFLEVVKDHVPFFSRCNAGATRMQHGKPVPRGSSTFVQAFEADFPRSKVVEVTFVQPVKVPLGAEWAPSLSGPWKIL